MTLTEVVAASRIKGETPEVALVRLMMARQGCTFTVAKFHADIWKVENGEPTYERLAKWAEGTQRTEGS